MSGYPSAKQLDVLVGQCTYITAGSNIPAGTSQDVSADFTGKTAGGTDTVEGVYTVPPQNVVYMYNADTGKSFQDSSGRQIFARLTEAAGVWTLSYFVLIAGVETAHDFTGSGDVGEPYNYRYCETVQVKDLSPTSVVNNGDNIDEIVASDPNSHQHEREQFVATAGQTVFNVANTIKFPDAAILSIYGISYRIGTDFTVSGTTVTWTDTLFVIDAGDCVYIDYEY